MSKGKNIGWGYKKVRDKITGRLRVITKDDIEYYKTPPIKLIKAFANGDKNARRMIYFEENSDNVDDSDCNKKIFDDGGKIESEKEKMELRIVNSINRGWEISEETLELFLGRKPEFREEIGGVKLQRCFLKPFYKKKPDSIF